MVVGSRVRLGSARYPAGHPEQTMKKQDENVRSIIRYLHEKSLHAGPKFVLNNSRRSLWIIHGGQEVRSVLSKCIKCQRAFKRPVQNKMGVLPEIRVTSNHPFSTVGLDLAGPFGVKMNGRATHKVWVVIFGC